MLLCLALAALGATFVPETPSEVVARLESTSDHQLIQSFDHVIQTLVELPPAETLPLLIDVLAKKEGDYAWQAGRTLRAIAKNSPKDNTKSTNGVRERPSLKPSKVQVLKRLRSSH